MNSAKATSAGLPARSPSLAEIFFGRLANLWRERRARRGRTGSRLHFEALENRLLLSADLIGDVPDPAQAASPLEYSAPVNGAPNDYTLRFNADTGKLELLDGTTVAASQALAATTAVVINGEDGQDDSLTVDFAFGGFFSLDGGITFNGGLDGFDALEMAGGEFTTVTHTVTTTGPELSGSIVYEDGVNSPLTIDYTGLEPVDMTGSTVDHLVFNLPGTNDLAILEDDGTAANGVSRIRSQSDPQTFDVTTFSNPNVSLTVNLGGDSATFTIASLPDFTAALTINGQAGGDNVVFTGTAGFSALSVAVGGSITDEADADIDVTGSVSLTAAGTITLGDQADNVVNFGTLTFASLAVRIAEDSATVLSGVSRASVVSLVANGSITDDADADITVTGGATFLTGAGAITLGDQVGNVVNFGTLIFTGGAVSITEDSATILSGVSTAGSLSLTSAGSIVDDANADIEVTENASFTASGPITLGDQAGNVTNFGTLTFVGGAVSIVEDSATVLSGVSTAGSLSLTAADSITDDADADADVTGSASFTAAGAITLGDQAGNVVNFGTLTFASLAVSITEDSATVLSGRSSASILRMVANGSISDDANAALAVTGSASFTASGAITLGDQTGNVTNFGSLTFNATDAVSIAEDSATVLSGVSTASSLSLTSTGSIVDDTNADIDVAGNASLAAAAITLGDQAGNVTNFGTLTFVGGAVIITEDSATVLSGVSTAGSLSLTSADSITDDADADLDVAADASFTASGAITLGDQAGNVVNFGTLTFVGPRIFVGGDVSISEDSATVLSGASSASNLSLTAAGSITDDADADIAVAGSANITAAGPITLGDNAANTTNFGSLQFSAAGAVSLSEDSETTILSGIASNNDINLSSTDALFIILGLDAGAGDIRLVADRVNQAAAGAITADELGILTGNMTLEFALNDVNTLAVEVPFGVIGHTGFRDIDDLTIGAVAAGGDAGFTGATGIVVNGNLDLYAGNLIVNQALNAGIAGVNGQVHMVIGTTVTQFAGGVITAIELGIRAGGDVLLATAVNDVNTLAVASTGLSLIEFRDSDDLTIGTVAAQGEFITTSGIASNGGDINLNVGSLSVDSSLDSGMHDISLTAPGGVSFTENAIVNVDLATDEFTVITISNAVTLGGTLNVEIVDPLFDPLVGERFRFMTFGSRSDAFFATTILPPDFFVDQTDPAGLDLVFDPNDAPVAVDDLNTTDEDHAVAGNVLANDTDVDVGDTLLVAAVNGQAANVGVAIDLASGARLTVNADGSYSYDPDDAFEFLGVGQSATDSFTYRASDSQGASSNTATVTVTVTGVNDTPVARDDSNSTDEESTVSGNVLTNDTDVDVGDTLLVAAVNGQAANVGVAIDLASGARLTVNADGSYSYDPDDAFEFLGAGAGIADSFTYTTLDSQGAGSNLATVTIIISGVNDAPVLGTIGNKAVDEQTLLTFTAAAVDVDSETLVFSLDAGAPVGAAIDPSSGVFTWTPTAAQGPGSYQVTVRVTDDGTPTLNDFETITIVVNDVATGGIDLEGAVNWDPDDLLIPGDREHVTVEVSNIGDTAVHQQVKVKLYASVDEVLDDSDIFLDQRLTGSDIEPGSSSTAQFNLVFPSKLLPGTYFLLAEVDPADEIAESNEENNTASGGSFDFHWMFGQVPDHGWETLTVRDADGTWVNFSLFGPGTGEITIDEEGAWDLVVTGTNGNSVLSILTLGGGDRRVALDDIHVTGALRGILAPKMDLTGTLAIDGALGAGMMIGSATEAVIAVQTILGRCLSGLSVQGIAILGDLEDSEILIGADLGADGQLGGSGANADTYSDGDLGDLLITGSMTSSCVRVGQDPGVDGIFDTGDDVLLDGSIDSITIRGLMSDDSFFVADDLPRYARIDGEKVYTETDPRFVDSLPSSGGGDCDIDWNASGGWGGGYSPFGSRTGQSNFSDFLVRLFG